MLEDATCCSRGAVWMNGGRRSSHNAPKKTCSEPDGRFTVTGIRDESNQFPDDGRRRAPTTPRERLPPPSIVSSMKPRRFRRSVRRAHPQGAQERFSLAQRPTKTSFPDPKCPTGFLVWIGLRPTPFDRASGSAGTVGAARAVP